MSGQRLSSHGVGASEISAIAGLNPYASPWDVWKNKIGIAPPITPEDADTMDLGHRMEPMLRQKYADVTGATMWVPPESLFHAERQWARATPDAIVVAQAAARDTWQHLVQCKNVGFWPGRDWRGGPPPYVQLQEQWEMMVTGLQRADVVALIGGAEFAIFTVARDNKVIADLVDIAEEFWRRVEQRREPDVDHSEACRDHFNEQLRKRQATELTADADLEADMAIWFEYHKQSRDLEKRLETIKNRIRAGLAEAQCSRLVSKLGTAALRPSGGGTTVNWRLVAELLGSPDPSRFRELVEANTSERKASLALYPPTDWSKHP